MISCQEVAKTYIVRERAGLFRRGARRQIDALHGIELTIEQGEFVGLLGRNGAGKTTLLKIVVTLLLPSQGKVEVDGIDALRDLWLGTPAMFPLTLQLGLLGALAVAYVALGWWALVHFERRARHHSLEGF